MRTYADVCGRMQVWDMRKLSVALKEFDGLDNFFETTQCIFRCFDVCGRMLTYADVCGRMLKLSMGSTTSLRRLSASSGVPYYYCYICVLVLVCSSTTSLRRLSASSGVRILLYHALQVSAYYYILVRGQIYSSSRALDIQ